MGMTEHTNSLDGNVIEVSVDNANVTIRFNDKDRTQTRIDSLEEGIAILKNELTELRNVLHESLCRTEIYHTNMEELRSKIGHYEDCISKDEGTPYIDNEHHSRYNPESFEKADSFKRGLSVEHATSKARSKELELNRTISEMEQWCEKCDHTIMEDGHLLNDKGK